MKTASESEQQGEDEKKLEIVEVLNPGQILGSSDAEAAVIEATDQRKQTGRKREKSRAEKDAHNDACRRSRKKIKPRRHELEKLETEVLEAKELKNLETEVVPKLLDENQNLKRELEERSSKTQLLENEIKELKAFKEQEEKREQMRRQILTSLEFNGQKISSLEHLQHLILSQPHDQQVCQGPAFTSITASDAGPSVPANPGYATLLTAPNNNLFSLDPAPGALRNPGAGSSSGASHGMPLLDDDPIVIEQFISELWKDPDPEKIHLLWQF